MTSTDVDTAVAALGGREITKRDVYDFDALVSQATIVDGANLEKDKERLIGVPHMITNITLRDGIPHNSKPTNYVSIEATIADAGRLALAVKRGQIKPDLVGSLTALDRVVYNDGSAGICRQAIAYLHEMGLITVPDGPNDGPVGMCRWDIYRAEWPDFDPDNPCPSFDVTHFAPRGLRVSEYEWNTKEAATFYWA